MIQKKRVSCAKHRTVFWVCAHRQTWKRSPKSSPCPGVPGRENATVKSLHRWAGGQGLPPKQMASCIRTTGRNMKTTSGLRPRQIISYNSTHIFKTSKKKKNTNISPCCPPLSHKWENVQIHTLYKYLKYAETSLVVWRLRLQAPDVGAWVPSCLGN